MIVTDMLRPSLGPASAELAVLLSSADLACLSSHTKGDVGSKPTLLLLGRIWADMKQDGAMGSTECQRNVSWRDLAVGWHLQFRKI